MEDHLFHLDGHIAGEARGTEPIGSREWKRVNIDKSETGNWEIKKNNARRPSKIRIFVYKFEELSKA